ncbi:MAG: hypothetical protein BWY43_00623 [candidate division WS2 bacterium ADurb.Bin280]|uniref:Glycosyltransferase RgtA/B/C/D-like domain-containing protein n=1 Tax=candidate division WS2 bacterium ADurb.Bin280 TaxID=1852829 RepID=A0A1V5SCB6_9BACT|nr:MAG: hypothetical protein BWY43_00623 [candidate division WS2 bacterium ADurb.Bin280]
MKVLEKIKKNKYLLSVGIIFILSVVSRLAFLSDRPLHHDEGMLSYFAWRLSHFGEYTYTPQIHSPILFYVQALLYLIFGARDVVSKVGPAIFGILLVMIPLFFYKLLGKRTAVFISLGFLISPIFLYYSRFLVHTTLVVVFWLLAVLFFALFFRNKNSIYLYLSSVSLALGFGTSETTYIFVAVALIFLLVSAIFSNLIKGLVFNIWDVCKKNYLDIIIALLIFVLVWCLIYSVGLTNPESLRRSMPILNDDSTGLGFWLAQHPKKLGGQPWHYYLILAIVYETLFVFGSLAFIIKFFKQKKMRTTFAFFVVVWAVGTLGVFSWAGEKFPWLFLPSLLPMVIATGIFLGSYWDKLKMVGKIFWVILAFWTAFVAFRLVYLLPSDTRELAVYVQTPDNFQNKIDKIIKECSDKSDKNCVLLDQKITWPLSWNFKDFSTLIATDNYSISSTTKYLIVGSESISNIKDIPDMSKEEVWIRDWWVPDKCRNLGCATKFLKYYFFREIWNDKGGYNVFIFSK